MKRICVFIGFIALLSACSKKGDTNPGNANSVTISGTSYPTVAIGNQVWTSLNYDGPGGYQPTSGYKSEFGSYYTRTQALSIQLPVGWRVPSMNDYNILLSNYTSSKPPEDRGYFALSEAAPLLTKGTWDITGTNSSGFSAQPAGCYSFPSGKATWLNNGGSAYFMTSDVNNTFSVSGFYIYEGQGARLGGIGSDQVDHVAVSLRFVKDK